MSFRLRAFALHLLVSGSVLTLILGVLYLGWYRWPGWYLSGAVHILALVTVIDLALGPSLTLLIANPRKRGAELARDISVIVSVQLAALVYGAATLWLGRPLYYAFSVDRLQLVRASDLTESEITLARRENPHLAPQWYSLPRWIWAPLPEDPQEAARIAQSAVLGGKDVIEMPRYFRRWSEGLPQLRERLQPLGEIRGLTAPEKQALGTQMQRGALAPEARNALLLWGDMRRVLVVFDVPTLRVSAILPPD